MCGIAGFVGPGDQAVLGVMIENLAHRGPDGQGIYSDAERQLFLGHARLAVLDLDHGAQPMWDAAKDIGVIFNGEIYNHKALRKELEARGHQFLSHHSDTEVLIHGYREWGKSLVEQLNGMFAFCLFDRMNNRLLLARDRMGEKPLYYFNNTKLFAFASEPLALFSHPQIPRMFDEQGVQKFFAYGYSPGETTVFKGVKKVLPGQILIYDLTTRRMIQERYFTFRISPEEGLNNRSEHALVEELRDLLRQAVALRLEADVPVGLFLSGGIDSGAVLAMARQLRSADMVDAFTIGFREESFDESEFAELAVGHFGCRHHLRKVTLDNARDLIGPIFTHLGEAFGDPSILPTSILAAFAREKVTVALSGDGGDELFAGYDPFVALRPAGFYETWVPKPLHKVMRRAANHFPVSVKNMSIDFKIKRVLLGLSYPKPIRLPVWMSTIEPDDMVSFFAKPLPPEVLYSEAIEVWNDNLTGNDVDRSLEFFTRLYLPDDILFKTDRASMMHSLEARAVFLDNGIVNFAMHLPHIYKFRNGRRKWLLKKALEGLIPRELIERKKKGFGIPLAAWLRDWSPPNLKTGPMINDDEVLSRWQHHKNRRSDERLFLWAWLSLQEIAANKNDQ